MKLPTLADSQRYQGLYVYEFGEWTAVGYTADELALLLDSERYRGGKIYKIHRAAPDGSVELRGVSADRFQLESGIFFYRADLPAARGDFRTLVAAAEHNPPPCRAFVQLAHDAHAAADARYATALIFPAEYEDEIGAWLTAIAFAGGDRAEGGISQVSTFRRDAPAILERQQLWGRARVASRPAHEVFAAVGRAVQR